MKSFLLSLLVASAAAIAQDADCSGDTTGCESTFVCAIDIVDGDGAN